VRSSAASPNSAALDQISKLSNFTVCNQHLGARPAVLTEGRWRSREQY